MEKCHESTITVKIMANGTAIVVIVRVVSTDILPLDFVVLMVVVGFVGLVGQRGTGTAA